MRTEKRTVQLAPVRVSERLEHELMRLAAADDRTLADYQRRVLEVHVFGHAATVAEPAAACSNCRA